MKKILIIIILVALLFLSACSDNINVINIDVDRSNNVLIDNYEHSYPRLGMWWLDAYETPVEDIARYDLLINEFDDAYLIDRLADIRRLNPNQILLRPISPSELNYYTYDDNNSSNPAVKYLPTGFFLMHIGSVLTEAVSIDDDVIYVENLKSQSGHDLFYEGDTISIGEYESAKIISVNKTDNSLTVERGFIRESSKHAINSKVQAHVSFWPETWVMNVSDACPKHYIDGYDEALDYITYFHNLTLDKIKGLFSNRDQNPYYINMDEANYDGFVIDRFEDHQSWLKNLHDYNRPLDPYYNGEEVSDNQFDDLIQLTVNKYTSLLENTYGKDKIIIRNNPLTKRTSLHDGQVYESSGWQEDDHEWWSNLFLESTLYNDGYEMTPYLKWKDNSLLFMEVYQDESFVDEETISDVFKIDQVNVDLKKVRFSLTSALLGDGYYSYEVHTSGHGSLGLYWFEFYDLGLDNKGYLGYPTANYIEIEDMIYMRVFENGLVIVNVSEQRILPEFNLKVTAVNGFEYKKENGIEPYDGCIFLFNDK